MPPGTVRYFVEVSTVNNIISTRDDRYPMDSVLVCTGYKSFCIEIERNTYIYIYISVMKVEY